MTQDPNFRFPTRPVRVLVEDPVDGDEREEGDSEGDGDGHGTLDLAPPWHEEDDPMGWVYDRADRTLYHRRMGKKIALRNLDTSQNITRLLSALEHRPEMEVDGLMRALQQASADCYHESLISVLSAHAGGLVLEWPVNDQHQPATAAQPEGEPGADPEPAVRRLDHGF